jgi:hypothetical protein
MKPRKPSPTGGLLSWIRERGCNRAPCSNTRLAMPRSLSALVQVPIRGNAADATVGLLGFLTDNSREAREGRHP